MHNSKSKHSQVIHPQGSSRRSWCRGQAVVEMALVSVILAMLLAAAIDMGRAYYTTIVVANMAGEGVFYASLYPDKDINFSSAGTCSRDAVSANNNIQDRARFVAKQRGLAIKNPTQANIDIAPASCVRRCDGQPITVTVSYRMDDLFLPRLVGSNVLTITRSSSQRMTTSAFVASGCPPP